MVFAWGMRGIHYLEQTGLLTKDRFGAARCGDFVAYSCLAAWFAAFLCFCFWGRRIIVTFQIREFHHLRHLPYTDFWLDPHCEFDQHHYWWPHSGSWRTSPAAHCQKPFRTSCCLETRTGLPSLDSSLVAPQFAFAFNTWVRIEQMNLGLTFD